MTDLLKEKAGEFWVEMANKEGYSFIVFAHIKFEHVLKRRIANRLSLNIANVKKSRIASERVIRDFRTANELAYALDIIDSQTFGFLDKLNSIRNRVVHREDYSISEDEFKNLINCAPQDIPLKDRIKKYKRIEYKIESILLGIFVMLESGMHNVVEIKDSDHPLKIDIGSSKLVTFDAPEFCGILSSKFQKIK
ncbi:MAG: hypothetical protein CMF62_06330 [Magnetococcales bacterium]|nr:hypothetical protein [Magnetococcales bacterium]|tara:strand:+ start:295813 stop:296394 length:582 start_codon:yes stop_codon:yes gene_type:complete